VLCVFVLYVLVTTENPSKTDEQIEVPLGADSRGSKEPHVRYESRLAPPDEWNYLHRCHYFVNFFVVVFYAKVSVI